jgi:hypothetical protein
MYDTEGAYAYLVLIRHAYAPHVRERVSVCGVCVCLCVVCVCLHLPSGLTILVGFFVLCISICVCGGVSHDLNLVCTPTCLNPKP